SRRSSSRRRARRTSSSPWAWAWSRSRPPCSSCTSKIQEAGEQMLKRLALAAALAAAACSPEPSGAPPCSGDANCPTGSYCDTASKQCVSLPANFGVKISSAKGFVTTERTVKFSASSPGGVSWAVQEIGGGTIDADGTYHAPSKT